jgi:hypothetical protein
MAKARKTKPRDRLVRWRVSLITKTPAGFVDFAYAPDAQAAERRVAREHKISGTLRPLEVCDNHLTNALRVALKPRAFNHLVSHYFPR